MRKLSPCKVLYTYGMVESLFLLGGIIIGAVITHGGYLIAGKTIHRTYEELTQLPHIALEDKEQEQGRPELPDGYDWELYDSFIQRAEDEDDVIPES